MLSNGVGSMEVMCGCGYITPAELTFGSARLQSDAHIPFNQAKVYHSVFEMQFFLFNLPNLLSSATRKPI